MTDEEFLAWGRAENHIRKIEMRAVKGGAADLAVVQAACKRRRVAVGLSAGQAATAVGLAQRTDRDTA